jgi:arylsulfatase A-like enzyme
VRRSLALSLVFFFLLQGCSAPEPRPNILLILLDDAGYGDIAGFAPDTTAPTPRLNQLANEGVRFTRFYADSTCQPARLSLMTGQQASRVATPPDFTGISPEVETLPEKLQQAGYQTFHIGKWHLGETTRLAWPSAQGFDHWFGFLNQFVLRGPDAQGKMKYRRPTYDNPWLQRDDAPPQQHNGHLEDLLADEVISTLRQQATGGQPWFINYWTFAPHNPAIASEIYLKQFPDTPEGRFQALLKQLDDNVARILQTLEETGQADNTLVIVLSDNGGTNEHAANNGAYAGVKGLYSEGGTRVPMIMYGPKHLPANRRYDNIATIYDLYPTLLSLAGVTVHNSDGVDLLPLVEQNKPRPPQPLFWEMATHATYQYSVLSADGRWRLDDGRLFDMQNDPYAKTDIAASAQETYRALKQEFLAWRRDVHRVPLPVETLQGGKAFRVTGDSFRRSPGDGPFTFVTSITPIAGVTPQGVIAEQKNMWSMILQDDQRIRLRMHDQEMVSEPLMLQQCTPLVLSVYYSRSGIQPQKDVGVWFLWAGGKQVLLETRPKPSLFPESFLEPTYAGQAADGKNPLTATLGSPQFYNEFYFLNDPWLVERDPQWLAEGMCGK